MKLISLERIIILASTNVRNQKYHFVYANFDNGDHRFALTEASFWPLMRGWYKDHVELMAEVGFRAFDEGGRWWDLYHFTKSLIDDPAMQFFRLLVVGR